MHVGVYGWPRSTYKYILNLNFHALFLEHYFDQCLP